MKINLNLKLIALVVLITAFIVIWQPLQFLISSPEEDYARSLEHILQSSAEIYIKIQKKIPTKFSDFVTTKGAAVNEKTLSLENVRRFSTITTLASDKFTASFKCGQTVTYYIRGGKITATYSGFYHSFFDKNSCSNGLT